MEKDKRCLLGDFIPLTNKQTNYDNLLITKEKLIVIVLFTKLNKLCHSLLLFDLKIKKIFFVNDEWVGSSPFDTSIQNFVRNLCSLRKNKMAVINTDA